MACVGLPSVLPCEVVRVIRTGFHRYEPVSTLQLLGGDAVILRSKPSSRTALMGEQPNPWDLLQPQDATSRHRGAKPCRRCDALQFLAAQTIPLSLFEIAASHGSHEFGLIGRDFHPSPMREVVTGEACRACLESHAASQDW